MGPKNRGGKTTRYRDHLARSARDYRRQPRGRAIHLPASPQREIRDVIDTIGKKGVLLLGRFTEGRLAVLERLRAELRKRDFVPMVFNFDKPETKDFTETVRLARRPLPLRHRRYHQPALGSPRAAGRGAGVHDPLRPHHRGRGRAVRDVPRSLGKASRVGSGPDRLRLCRGARPGLDKEIIKPALARFDELVVKKAEKLRVRRIGT